MSVFILENIEKEYTQGGNNEKVLKGVDLVLESESITALIGSSGSGKSTLLTIAAGLQSASKGNIKYGDADLFSMTRNAVRNIRANKFGFIFQHAHLVPFLTVKEQLELMIDVAGIEWSKKERNLKIKNLLETVDMWYQRDRYPENLSGGEKQRTAIARAVIHEPEILFADEPTASLDSKRSEEVMQLIYSLAKDKKITVLMVTHDSEMLSFADRIVEMKDGIIQSS